MVVDGLSDILGKVATVVGTDATVSLKLLPVEYKCKGDLNIYDSPECSTLATQAATGRHLRLFEVNTAENISAIPVQLWEDDYPGWLAAGDVEHLLKPPSPLPRTIISSETINQAINKAIAFCHQAAKIGNTYLWGGTVGPNYDCSGLIQAAFSQQGIWLPRDAYQQQAFVQPIPPVIWEMQPGDLVFFGTTSKTTHVGLYLGDGQYIHSSGPEHGNNGIGYDELWHHANNPVSQYYAEHFIGVGRVVSSYPFDAFGRFHRQRVKF
ncbi:MAG: C40 family peptidase [Limnospira sp. PMC 1291.21]|jgi:cell wall-associated NlpC family hydrolase|uniref:NLP/P60 protein n=2 Tax=Limnospira TaxID=2596745 RepID=B5W0E5_LIMMA|nr:MULTISPECIES: C40 family peptidase [Limnospira]EKD10341.1 putative NLP/P60 [Arthrospira platensis C1]MDY7053717.1 C40 family peptidase [Limnospira fusiformis LS22]QJB29659.1 C40 family peptidase [Limnospira fusiformis SAG 85.79]EDZ95061.1 NLP/P60 protein [Limnospira maxima CS-328]MDT9177096.1 C40 family peptidase [Limnospira sp. PMC 1238.20]